ncbi:hypothetical protein C7S10_08620 [Nocardioides currus]|uniref:SnoaL-like domain-containing protein n=1 Tax=Nocardioides currus TaxID=2133958 RepID=A0A2R7Z0I7_9ACTN|nr:hypothetical protein C7S10_08620 [Nocardioides currus]
MDASMRDRVDRHYRRCEEVLRARDLDGFMDWLGADGTFPAADGTVVRIAGTRPFWAWRFANVLRVTSVELRIEDISYDDDGLLVVDFHERGSMTVGGFDGLPVERAVDLHNRNLWEVSEDRFTARGGAELAAHRTIGGERLTDETDPWGFGAWERFKASG